MPSATVKPSDVTYFPLIEPEDWGKALVAAMKLGYRGKFEGYQDASGADVLAFELNGPGNPFPVTATIGDVYVWDGTRFESMSTATFSAKHEVQ